MLLDGDLIDTDWTEEDLDIYFLLNNVKLREGDEVQENSHNNICIVLGQLLNENIYI